SLVGIWFFAFTGMLLATRAGVAELWGRAALVAVCLLPGAVYDFTATALRLYSARRFLIRTVWIIGIAFAIVAAFTRGLVDGVTSHSWGFYASAGPLAAPFLLFFFAVLIAQAIEGVAEYKRTADPKRKARVGNLMLSFGLVYLAAIDFLPMVGINLLPP